MASKHLIYDVDIYFGKYPNIYDGRLPDDTFRVRGSDNIQDIRAKIRDMRRLKTNNDNKLIDLYIFKETVVRKPQTPGSLQIMQDVPYQLLPNVLLKSDKQMTMEECIQHIKHGKFNDATLERFFEFVSLESVRIIAVPSADNETGVWYEMEEWTAEDFE